MINLSCLEEFLVFLLIVFICLNGIFGFIIVCGNFLVLMVIFWMFFFCEVFYVFIGLLVVVDFIIGFVMNLIYVVIVGLSIIDFDYFLNVVEYYFWIYIVIIIIFNLVGMSVEKYIVVIYFLYYLLVVIIC